MPTIPNSRGPGMKGSLWRDCGSRAKALYEAPKTTPARIKKDKTIENKTLTIQLFPLPIKTPLQCLTQIIL